MCVCPCGWLDGHLDCFSATFPIFLSSVVWIYVLINIKQEDKANHLLFHDSYFYGIKGQIIVQPNINRFLEKMTLSIWYRFFALNVALNRKCSACCSICISVGLWIVDFILWTKIKEIKYVFSARRCYDFKFMDPHCFCFLFEIYKLQQYDSWTDSLTILAIKMFVGTICTQKILWRAFCLLARTSWLPLLAFLAFISYRKICFLVTAQVAWGLIKFLRCPDLLAKCKIVSKPGQLSTFLPTCQKWGAAEPSRGWSRF